MKWKPLLVITCCVLLTGCWDRVELNDVSIVAGIAVDKGKEKRFCLTVEAINASQFSKTPGGDAAPVATFTLEGDTVAELSRKMNVGFSRRLIFSHTRVLYISEEIAREGLIDFLDFLDRSGQFRNDFNILITRGNEASDFTKITYPVQKVPSLKVHKQAQSITEEWGGDPNVRLTDFIASVTATGKSAVASSVEITGDPAKGEKMSNNSSTHVDAMVELRGMGVFKQDKLIGFLSLEDTRNYYWTQELKSTNLSVPCGKTKDGVVPYDAIRVMLTFSKLKVDLVNGKPVLKVDIVGESRLEATQCTKDLALISTYEDIENRINRHVEEQITATIKKVQQQYKQDIFGFGEAFNRQHHKGYLKVEKKWNEEFAQADVAVNVNLHMRRSGIRGKGFLSEVPREE